MITVPTDRAFKFLAVISLIVSLFFVVFPDLFSYYSKREIVSIEMRRIEISQEISTYALALDRAKHLIKSNNPEAKGSGQSLLDSLIASGESNQAKLTAVKFLVAQQQSLEGSYTFWINLRIWIIIFCGIVFALTMVAWIRYDHKELTQSKAGGT